MAGALQDKDFGRKQIKKEKERKKICNIAAEHVLRTSTGNRVTAMVIRGYHLGFQ